MSRGAPKGNKFAKGNKGGRRPSAYKENANADFLLKVWEGKISLKQVTKMVESRKHGAMHAFALKCLTGDMDAMKKLIDKLYANKTSVAFVDETERPSPDDLTADERKEIERATAFLKPSSNVKKKRKTKT